MTKKVDQYYDLIDKAALLYYEHLRLDYLEALIRISKDIVEGVIDSRFDDSSFQQMEKIYQELENTLYTNEEVRLAWELLIIKAFKDRNLGLELMTPDTINYLVAAIVSGLFPEEDIKILDTTLGTGNLLHAVSNYFPQKAELIGIEKDETLARLAEAGANLINSNLLIYHQDALLGTMEVVDLVIGDVDAYFYEDELLLNSRLYQKGIRYFPYLVLEARLMNLKPKGYFVLIIENDFFSKNGTEIFQNYLKQEANILGLVVLPKTMFQRDYIGKSIIIGSKSTKKREVQYIELTDLQEESLKECLIKIKIMTEKIVEEMKC